MFIEHNLITQTKVMSIPGKIKIVRIRNDFVLHFNFVIYYA